MCDRCDSLEDRLDELEEDIEFIRNDTERWRSDVYRPSKESAAAERDDARQERVELLAAVDALQRRVQELEGKLDNLVGVEDANESNPAKRADDLRLALLRDAEARNDQHAGKSQMWWREVQRFFAQNGHGKVTKPDCYKAMRWAAGEGDGVPEAYRDAEGFKLTTKVNQDDREVKAVAVDAEVASYADTAAEAPSSGPTTGNSTGTIAETD